MIDVFIERNRYGNWIISMGSGVKEQYVYFTKANALSQFRRKYGLVHRKINIIDLSR
jgi:hypothetical protein